MKEVVHGHVNFVLLFIYLIKMSNMDSGGSKGGGSNSFNFMQFFGKIRQNRMLAPPPGVDAPTWGKSCVSNFFYFYAVSKENNRILQIWK